MVSGELCDLHSHFLPGMDDGCKTPEESVQLLEYSAQQGITAMFATPHYYPVETVADFLGRRDRAEATLRQALRGKHAPKLCMGAEVAFRPGLSYEEDLQKLCLGHSRYMLLELPFSRWGQDVLREVRNISSVHGITPILAHVERYLHLQTRDMLEQMLSLDVLAQINAESLLQFSTRRKCARMLREGVVQLLGSDCHNLTSRQQNLNKAFSWLASKTLEEPAQDAADMSMEIFRQASE